MSEMETPQIVPVDPDGLPMREGLRAVSQDGQDVSILRIADFRHLDSPRESAVEIRFGFRVPITEERAKHYDCSTAGIESELLARCRRAVFKEVGQAGMAAIDRLARKTDMDAEDTDAIRKFREMVGMDGDEEIRPSLPDPGCPDIKEGMTRKGGVNPPSTMPRPQEPPRPMDPRFRKPDTPTKGARSIETMAP